MPAVPFEIEGEVFEVLHGCGLASIASLHGAIYTLDRQTPGIDFNELYEGRWVRCELGGDATRVLHAELVT